MGRSLPYLQLLVKAKPRLQKLIMQHALTDVIHAIRECSLNILKGVIPVTPRQKRSLARYKTHLRALASKKVAIRRKKKYINQQGGGLLTSLLVPALSLLSSLLIK